MSASVKRLAAELHALAHPVRLRAIRRIDEEGSPKRLAGVLGLPLPVVGYHVRALRDAGLIELVETRPARGAITHIYRVSARGHELLQRIEGL